MSDPIQHHSMCVTISCGCARRTVAALQEALLAEKTHSERVKRAWQLSKPELQEVWGTLRVWTPDSVCLFSAMSRMDALLCPAPTDSDSDAEDTETT